MKERWRLRSRWRQILYKRLDTRGYYLLLATRGYIQEVTYESLHTKGGSRKRLWQYAGRGSWGPIMRTQIIWSYHMIHMMSKRTQKWRVYDDWASDISDHQISMRIRARPMIIGYQWGICEKKSANYFFHQSSISYSPVVCYYAHSQGRRSHNLLLLDFQALQSSAALPARSLARTLTHVSGKALKDPGHLTTEYAIFMYSWNMGESVALGWKRCTASRRTKLEESVKKQGAMVARKLVVVNMHKVYFFISEWGTFPMKMYFFVL
jgi:hypothetical protein